MAEMCSAFPAVGSVYYWSFYYCPFNKWAPLLAYITGWFNLIGNVSFGSFLAYGMAQILSACISLMSIGKLEASQEVQVALSIAALAMWAAKNTLSLPN